jgi:hypothetical protein
MPAANTLKTAGQSSRHQFDYAAHRARSRHLLSCTVTAGAYRADLMIPCDCLFSGYADLCEIIKHLERRRLLKRAGQPSILVHGDLHGAEVLPDDAEAVETLAAALVILPGTQIMLGEAYPELPRVQ